MRGAELQGHLMLGAKIEHLLVTALVQIPDVERMTVLPAEQKLTVHGGFNHGGRTPFTRDHGVVTKMPPEVVSKLLPAALGFSRSFDCERCGIDDEHGGGAVRVYG